MFTRDIISQRLQTMSPRRFPAKIVAVPAPRREVYKGVMRNPDQVKLNQILATLNPVQAQLAEIVH